MLAILSNRLHLPAPASCPANAQIVIYCGPGSTPEGLCEHVALRFNLQIMPTFLVRGAGRHGLLLVAGSCVEAACTLLATCIHGLCKRLPPACFPASVQCVPLHNRNLLLPNRYPRFTMVRGVAARECWWRACSTAPLFGRAMLQG